MKAANEITPEELKKELRKSNLQRHLTTQLKQNGIQFVEEYQFSESRKWRFDISLNHLMDGGHKICNALIDIQGGTWSGGAHVRGKGYRNDVEKMNAATSLGFQVYWFTGDMIEDGSAITFILDYILK